MDVPLPVPADAGRSAIQMSLHSPLASHPDSEEYQFDRTIIWIQIPNHGARYTWIAKGNAMFHAVWRDTREVLEMAQTQSRMEHPEFWEQAGLDSLTDSVLAVRGIWINPADETAGYDVCDTSTEHLPDDWDGHLLPNEYCVHIARDRDGKLTVDV